MHTLIVDYAFASSVRHPDVPAPDGWAIEIREYRPSQETLAAADIVQLMVTLQASGVLDWVRDKSFDALWEYVSTWRNVAKPQAITLEVVDANGATLRAILPPDLVNIPASQVKMQMRSQVLANGSANASITVVIDRKVPNTRPQ